MPHANSLELAQRVLRRIKREVTSLNDIIPLHKLPHFYERELPRYLHAFGALKVKDYLSQAKLLTQVRDAAKELVSLHGQNMIAPETTAKVAISLCGVGECDETSSQAIMHLLAMNCQDQINMICLTGKPCVEHPNPSHYSDYYNHVFIILGDIETGYNANPQEFFKSLPQDYLYLDPSLDIITTVGQTPRIESLQEINKAFAFDRVFSVTEYNLQDHAEPAKTIIANAKFISEIIMRKLDIRRVPRSLFFSGPEKKVKAIDEKPTALLVDDQVLDWNSCMAMRDTRFSL